MFLSDVLKKEECRNEALQELRKLGIKCRPKKPKQLNVKQSTKLFKIPLGLLPTETVTLSTGHQIAVPKLVHELCSIILTKVNTEGIFRKEGSRVRQGEMKLILNGGGALDRTLHVIDVAVLLKTFLRELPEPLIPFSYHELFLRCIILDGTQIKVESLLLACLLLPVEHLNTLTYLMQFFNEVAEHSSINKMNAFNLAVVVGPNIFPIDDKTSSQQAQARTKKFCEIVQLLIENSFEIGIIPEHIINHLGTNATTEFKKKKRRSGSLTRMFNGLKKIVGGKSVDDTHTIVTPDLLMTPINNNVVKKRRIQSNGISYRKKKEILNKLPDSVLLNTPITPCRTPVNMNSRGNEENQGENVQIKQKKSQWFSRSKSVKNLNKELETENKLRTKTVERRWSALGEINTKRNKKRNSFASTTRKEVNPDLINNTKIPDPDYIRVSKEEYEEIKRRVSTMERRISLELDTVQYHIKTDNENNRNVEADNNLQNVLDVYEQTLEQSTQLSPTTDQLAKRLSRELKIRRSTEQRIIRSPSARKIGSMRRKSKELERSNAKLARHRSWHVASSDQVPIPRASLRRGKPNTIQTGLPTNKSDSGVMEVKEISRSRSSSVGEKTAKNMSTVTCNRSGSSCDTWISAEGFFATLKSNNDSSSLSDRASLAKLRSQNAGMVLAKAKLFDKLKESDSSSNSSKSLPRLRIGSKIGSGRTDSRMSYRVRTLRYEDKRMIKKSMSPRRKHGYLSQKQKMQIVKHYLDAGADKDSDKENTYDANSSADKNSLVPLKDRNRIDAYFSSPKYSTPVVPPHIKKTLNVRSPKRLCRTPGGVERQTPLRALRPPVQNQM